ncbi:hypothetical protein [Streptomyces marispadix]|uniref:Uncharacterized protein n=1 Tax=Streptomyces marispadix TaxID=2922868 RepID=A0ABS9SVF2_9ACTN|nr:hypothetical protein [Streptomyces marispadix]MCH6160250.1 hypothetical protein [Streptomyces marispadix]
MRADLIPSDPAPLLRLYDGEDTEGEPEEYARGGGAAPDKAGTGHVRRRGRALSP